MTATASLPSRTFGAEMWLWARMLPFLCVKTKSFAGILTVSKVGSSRRYRGMAVTEIVGKAKRASRHPWLMRDRRCLREGILAYRFLTLADVPAKIHFGVDRTTVSSPKLEAHCWVTVDDQPVINPPAPTMVTIYVRDNQISGTA